MPVMTSPLFAPPVVDASELDATLQRQGHAVLDAATVSQLSGCPLEALQALLPYWDDLPPDAYLKDGGRYRRRRHSCFVLDGDKVTQAPHRAHWQPLEYNALHGGMQRLFEPMAPALVHQPVWAQLLRWLGRVTLRAQGRAALVRRGAPVPHRHHRRHRPAHARGCAPRRRRPGGRVPAGAPGRERRRDARVRGRGPERPALHAEPSPGRCCCWTMRA